MVKLSYDFKRFVEGLNVYALYTVGSGRKNSATGDSLPTKTNSMPTFNIGSRVIG